MSASLLIVGSVVLALVVLNGLFVAAEFALIGASRPVLEALARSGRRPARRALALVSDLRALDRSITTAQAGITAASLGLGMYGEHAVAGLIRARLGETVPALAAAHGMASLLAVAALTVLHIVLGELVPKALALQHPTSVAVWTEVPLRWTRRLLAPLVLALDVAAAVVLRLIRARPAGEAERAHTLEEIGAVIEESGERGLLAPAQTGILTGLVAIEDLPVRKVMLPRTRVFALSVAATPAEALALLRESEHTRFPVHEGSLDRLLGYVHVKDLMRAMEGPLPFDLRSLTRPLPVIPETATCARLFRLLRRRRTQIALVVDEHGGTAGIVTLEDLIEEIFGEVQDEFDIEEPALRRLPGGVAVARGSTRLDEINDALGLELGGEDVDTIGGLVVERLGRTARAGDVVRLEGVTLAVEAVDRHAVARVRIAPDRPAA